MAILLKGRNGNEFELGIEEDSLPDTQDGTGDAHWATIYFRAAWKDETLEESAPCMNLFELQMLADWLDAVGQRDDGGSFASEVELLQPELRFGLTQSLPDTVTIRIGFHMSDRPELFNVDAPTDEANYIDIHIEREQVRAAGRQLRQRMREISAENLKDDLSADSDAGVLGTPDATLNLLNTVTDEPAGMGHDADEGYIEKPGGQRKSNRSRRG